MTTPDQLHNRPRNPYRKDKQKPRRQDFRISDDYLKHNPKVKIISDYGHLKEGTECRVLGFGYDWVAVQHRGSRVHVPKSWCGRVFQES